MNSLVNKTNGETLTDRIQKAAGCAEMMGYIKTTYQNKRTVIKGKILPMGLYGCEVAPVNEVVLTRLRGVIANVITFTTKIRAVDLTFAVTAEKGDLDPDVEICRRRVTALRRCYHGNDEDAAMIQDIYEKYKENDEPATKHTKEDLLGKDVFGPPASKERASLRKQCRPHGPVGLLLETMHLQTAALTDKFIIKQWNQPAIDVLQAPHQHLPVLIQQMCTRNRTRMAENERHETENLVEIDAYATSGHMKEIDNEDLMQLNLVRTGSLWTKSTAYWTGRDEEKTCSICQEEAETAEHIIWRCKPLAKKRREADSILASIDCKLLPAPVRHGIAPALKATMPGTFWGTTGEELPEEARLRCGCDERDGKHLPAAFKDICKQITARECMQGATAKSEEMTKLPLPPKISGKPPEKPNGYTDGSYVNSAGNFWGLGWVGRRMVAHQTNPGGTRAS